MITLLKRSTAFSSVIPLELFIFCPDHNMRPAKMLFKALLILVIDISTQCSQDIDFVVDIAKHKVPPSPKRTRSDVIGQELVHTAHGTTASGLLVCCCASVHVASTVSGLMRPCGSHQSCLGTTQCSPRINTYQAPCFASL